MERTLPRESTPGTYGRVPSTLWLSLICTYMRETTQGQKSESMHSGGSNNSYSPQRARANL